VTKVKAQENVVDGAEELFNSNLFGSEDNKHKISDIKERSPKFFLTYVYTALNKTLFNNISSKTLLR
jgi:hypothetical protein